ncbi:hypothetical protein CPC08DRAFT_787142 [Agrocybe pediades]|nr:hypothetical protein CPC08DRAFT_787142 [Agrocybe pediades]
MAGRNKSKRVNGGEDYYYDLTCSRPPSPNPLRKRRLHDSGDKTPTPRPATGLPSRTTSLLFLFPSPAAAQLVGMTGRCEARPLRQRGATKRSSAATGGTSTPNQKAQCSKPPRNVQSEGVVRNIIVAAVEDKDFNLVKNSGCVSSGCHLHDLKRHLKTHVTDLCQI